METHDYFLFALAFLVSTIVMTVVVILWVPRQDPVGYMASQGGGFIYLDSVWPLAMWIFLPFSLFLGFLTARLRQYIFAPITTDQEHMEPTGE